MSFQATETPSDVTCDCGQFHETRTRYDHELGLLSFLLSCPVCSIERLVECVLYTPRFVPQAEYAAQL